MSILQRCICIAFSVLVFAEVLGLVAANLVDFQPVGRLKRNCSAVSLTDKFLEPQTITRIYLKMLDKVGEVEDQIYT